MATWVCTATPRSRRPTSIEFARQSVRLKNFYVSPVCAPTRASLLTGRYNYRTGVVDTYLGRAMMHPDEVTLAEMLAAAGYRTGIFGKWHLGDNAPLRPIDQGFRAVAGDQGGRHRPAVRPARRQQLLRPDLAAQRPGRTRQGLLQRHLRAGRHRVYPSRRTTVRSSPTSRSTARTSRWRRPSPSWRPTRR